AVGLADIVLSRLSHTAWVQQHGGPTMHDLKAVAALNMNDAWAVGQLGTTLHYNGASWQVISSTITADLYGVQMLAPQEGYAVGGSANAPGVIGRWDGQAWMQVATTTTTLYSVAMTGSGAGWAVGAGGAIWRATGGTWTPAASPTGTDLRAVAMDSPTHGWAVGGTQDINQSWPVLLEYTGGTWVDRTASLPSSGALANIVLAPGGQTGLIVGASTFPFAGVILRLNGGIWMSDASTAGLCGVAFDSGNTAWAVGADHAAPVAYHYDGSTWQGLALPVGYTYPFGLSTLLGLAIVPGQGGWVVGAAGTILRYDPPPPPATPTVTVTGTPPTGTPTATRTPLPPSATPSQTATPVPPSTATPSPVLSPTPVPTAPPPPATATPSRTPGPPSPTSTPGAASPTAPPSPTFGAPTATAVPRTATATPCAISFTDVQPSDYFYTPVLYLACHGVISGYADGTFRPFAQTTRAQMVKIVVLGFQKAFITPAAGAYTFADVPPAHPFFAVVETAAADTIVSGYTCGGPGEPCDNQQRPYFRPAANVTRGQLSKIAVVAAGWLVIDPATASFADVVPGTAFYPFVATAACHGIISGYSCGGIGEPCDSTHQPYFRPANPATRGQIAKIVDLAITGGVSCGAPARPGPAGVRAP
ncbi:MAG TPA: S-layer homology domain-containing protein, partial [Chloroflexia bacterium]|nr:S-layer homology domain-containing protein [Chloroflexia bacterium]